GQYAGRNLDEMPAVVLLDLKLPKLTGLEVLRTMRSNPLTSRLPVVILTSSNQDRDLIEGYDLGANSFICKPVDFDKFSESIGRLGMYWVLLNEAPPKARKTRKRVACIVKPRLKAYASRDERAASAVIFP